jgi:hypothetical protein
MLFFISYTQRWSTHLVFAVPVWIISVGDSLSLCNLRDEVGLEFGLVDFVLHYYLYVVRGVGFYSCYVVAPLWC